MKAAGDSGLKVRFAAYWIDQPGNIANAGATALGHYNVSSFYRRGQRRGDGGVRRGLQGQDRRSIRCSSRATRCTASGDSARR